MRKTKGIFIAEALIALAIISTVVLVVVVSYRGITRALNNTRVRKQAVQYAQAEIQRYVNLDRVAQRDTSGNIVLVSSQPVAWGYNNLAGPNDDGVERPFYYPEYLMGSESSSFQKERYVLYRTVTIATVNAGNPDEYKTITVKLRDSATPARFAPISFSTKMRKPDPSALDTRQAVDMASLYVKALDQSIGNPPIALTSSPVAALGGAVNTSHALSAAGDYTFGGLTTQGTYTATFTANGYWWQIVPGIALAAGPNTLPGIPILLQPVYFGTVNVTVQDPSSNPLPNATVTVDFPSGSPPPLLACCSVSNYATYTFQTNASGVATQSIPLPVSGTTTYGNGSSTGYRLHTIILSGYLNNLSNGLRVDNYIILNSMSPANFGPYILYPYIYAGLNVTVQDTSSNPLNQCYVQVIDNGNEGGGLIDANKGNTNSSGYISFPNVRVNYPSNPTSTTRTVIVRVQRVGYQLQNQLVTLTQGSPTSVTIQLPGAQLSDSWAPGGGLSCTIPASCNFAAHGLYAGHSGQNNDQSTAGGTLNILSYTPTNVTSVVKSWSWSLLKNNGTPSDKGYLSSPSNDQITLVPLQPGNANLTVTINYSFNYTGSGSPTYGPNLGTLSYVFSDTQTVTINNGTTPTLTTVIKDWLGSAGTTSQAPSTTKPYTTFPSYGGNPLPSDLAYSWTASGSGTISPLNAQSSNLTTYDNTHLGESITLNSCVTSATLGCPASGVAPGGGNSGCDASNGCSLCGTGCATATHQTVIAYPPLSVAISQPSGIDKAVVNMSPYTFYSATATITGGSGSFSETWSLIDPVTLVNYGHDASAGSILSPDGVTYVNFQAAVTGEVLTQINVTDTVTSNTANTYFEPNVQSGGSSN